MFNIKCFIKKANWGIKLNLGRVRINKFCEKSNDNLPSNWNTQGNIQENDSETKRKLDKLSRMIPMDQVNQSVLEDVIKYKVLEDSVGKAVEELKTEVPEIAKHKEFRDWVNSVIDQDKQEEALQKEGIIILKNKTDVFHKYGIDTHNFRKFHDRDYEVNIEELLTKDLYEKQRVVDNFVEENKTQINNLMGYFNNRFKHLNYNKYNYLIFKNNYEGKMRNLKLNMIKNTLSTSLLSAVFAWVNPLLLLLLIPEYYSIAYMSILFNSLVDQIILTESKQSVVIRTFNFLGFKTELRNNPIRISSLFYDNKIKNDVLVLNDKGCFFITRLIRRLFRSKNKKTEENFDNFKTFHKIRLTGKNYFIPADCSSQHEDTNEELVLHLINGNLKRILEYDYSKYENRMKELYDQIEEFNKLFAKKMHSHYYSEEDKFKDKYSKYEGNRDFSDSNYEITLKRRDGMDGTYIDNGYR